jgi:hypothetical protein
MKQGHADSAPLKKARQRTPSTELYVYSANELARFEKRDMLAILSILMVCSTTLVTSDCFLLVALEKLRGYQS